MKKLFLIPILLIIPLVLSACSLNKNNAVTQEDGNSDNGQVINQEESILLDGSYEIKTKSSLINWSAEKIVGSSHVGTISIKSGSFEVRDSNIVDANFVIDMNSITESKNNESFLKHLRSDDFFSVEMYPEAKFTLTESEKLSNNSYEVEGILSIKDVSESVEFVININEASNNIAVISSFEIDRTKWGIKYGSGSIFTDLGDKAIKDMISFQLELEALKK